MTLLYHLFFTNVQAIISHYCIFPEWTIISLMTFLLYHLFLLHYFYLKLLLPLFLLTFIIALIILYTYYCNCCYYHTIICIISFPDYYCYYRFQFLLYSLFVSQNIISIMAVMTTTKNAIMDIIDIIAIIVFLSHLHTILVFGYTNWV